MALHEGLCRREDSGCKQKEINLKSSPVRTHSSGSNISSTLDTHLNPTVAQVTVQIRPKMRWPFRRKKNNVGALPGSSSADLNLENAESPASVRPQEFRAGRDPR